ncbi:S-adenosyl-L-methionine-dependent methyltransferases superfamily protein [Perilla frutescens var. hirtella]|uniref:S-adenosyl-L-methionine-dependent methyltransferases superfamily protein n=1 Tax=Perilla frutescens var. hirtella TaxID=608512 RepID=A0AAD4PA94_PERFH|nr:S-adenosyl-L-methionine-dependent methyltransferases superfamily protein [Perilla frutescens var. hirtella]
MIGDLQFLIGWWYINNVLCVQEIHVCPYVGLDQYMVYGTVLMHCSKDCKKTFPSALCMGSSLEAVRRLLHGRGGIEKLLMMDTSVDMVKLCKQAKQNSPNKNVETSFIVADEEFLPVKESYFWWRDFKRAENSVYCGPNGTRRRDQPSVVTFGPGVRDAGNLLTRAGFTLPGVNVDEYTVRYNSAWELIEHLRTIGETNALLQRSKILKRHTALATTAIYESMFGAEDGTIPATFQVIFMTGWREHPSQQRAKKRGSATVSFKDLQKQFGGDTLL